MYVPLKSQLNLLAVALTIIPGPRTITNAQGIGEIPPCAQNGVLEGFEQSGCSLTDAKCICSKEDLFPSILASLDGCTEEEKASLATFGSRYCGVEIPLPENTTPEETSMSTAATKTQTAGNAMPASTTQFTSSMGDIPSSPTGHPNMTTGYNGTMAPGPTNGTMPIGNGAPMNTGMSIAALAVAILGMGWVFAEL